MSDLTPDEIETIFLQLDAADQAAHIGASWVARAAERRRQPDSVRLASTDPETTAVFAELEPPADRLVRHAERSRSVGIDDDLIGCSIAHELLEAGHDAQEVARLIADAGIAWRPRTDEERLIAAAAELLSYGLDPGTIREAFATLEAS